MHRDVDLELLQELLIKRIERDIRALHMMYGWIVPNDEIESYGDAHFAPSPVPDNWESSRYTMTFVNIGEKVNKIVSNHTFLYFSLVVCPERGDVVRAFGFSEEISADDVKKIRDALPGLTCFEVEPRWFVRAPKRM